VRTSEATKCYPRAKRICGNFGSAKPVNTRRRPMSTSLTTMIVALARKLLIALWRLVTTGEVPDGVELRPAA
jgi:hypothetical protein